MAGEGFLKPLKLLPRRRAATDRTACRHALVQRGTQALQSASMRRLLPHDRQERVGTTAIALDDPSHLIALADLHARSVDRNVGDEHASAAVRHIPIELDQAALAHDLARDDRLVAVLPRAGD